jgi:hypothetical protein
VLLLRASDDDRKVRLAPRSPRRLQARIPVGGRIARPSVERFYLDIAVGQAVLPGEAARSDAGELPFAGWGLRPGEGARARLWVLKGQPERYQRPGQEEQGWPMGCSARTTTWRAP